MKQAAIAHSLRASPGQSLILTPRSKMFAICWQLITYIVQLEFDIYQYTSSNNSPTDTGDRLIQCCSSTCPVGRFHVTCHAADGVAEAQEWFCSDTCRESGGYIYCWCQKDKGGRMIECGRGATCSARRLYHVDCNLTPVDVAGGYQNPFIGVSQNCHLHIFQMK